MRLELLKSHPNNDRIYQATDLSDLKNSLSSVGQLEPIAITKDNQIISGHRRYAAMQELGWEDCEVRLVEPENETIALIEHNRHRQKTASDIVNEAKFLEKELREMVGRGRHASRNRTETNKNKRLTTAFELASRLNVGTTRLKQLLSISNYEPELLTRIDRGNLSVSAAYQIIKTKYLQGRKPVTNEFESSFKKLITNNTPKLSEVMTVLSQTYPYSLELTGVSEDRRMQLIEHLEYLKTMDSRTLMLKQKQDELEHLDLSRKEINNVKKYLPSAAELNEFWKMDNAIDKIKTVICDGTFTDKKTRTLFSKQFFDTLAITLSSKVRDESPGRKMNGCVGFETATGFKILGILSFRSDSHTLKVRDDLIGWTKPIRAKNREHIVNVSVCVPTQPFGHDRLGGKFIALYAHRFVDAWEKKYNIKVIGLITTSLHGTLSQYTNLKGWNKLGSTSGEILLKPLRDEWSFWRAWLKEHHSKLYDDLRDKTSPTQGMIGSVYRFLNIPTKEYTHTHRRGVFFSPRYSNYIDFLNDRISEKELQTLPSDWEEWWIRKSNTRLKKLTTEGRVSNEKLFHEEIDANEIDRWVSVQGVI